jgi:hypothetical protein
MNKSCTVPRMEVCGKCIAFLSDYLDESLNPYGALHSIANGKNIRAHKSELINAILRSQQTLNNWIFMNMRKEYETRVNLFEKKPQTREEEYLFLFYILKCVGIAFSLQLPQMEELILEKDMVRFKQTDTGFERKDQFLANLFIPLIENLELIHR